MLGRASSACKRIRQLAAGELHLLAATGARVERRSSILVDAGAPVATRDQLTGYLLTDRDPYRDRGPQG